MIQSVLIYITFLVVVCTPFTLHESTIEALPVCATALGEAVRAIVYAVMRHAVALSCGELKPQIKRKEQGNTYADPQYLIFTIVLRFLGLMEVVLLVELLRPLGLT